VRTEVLPDRHRWLRVADPAWEDPLDPSYATSAGGRWNPPGSFPALYLNEDVVTARVNVMLFIAGWPYQPEDLRDDTGPVLVTATLPRRQRVCDVHSPAGVAAVGLPPSYPLDASGQPVGHSRCALIGAEVRAAGLRGVRYRSARTPFGAGRELAWFPATARSRARLIGVQAFSRWFYA
jgi:hypothetical protein